MAQKTYDRNSHTAYKEEMVDVLDPSTGEIITGIQVHRTVYGDDLFTKTRLLFYTTMVSAMQGTLYMVLFWMVRKMNQRTNIFVGTQKDLIRDLSLSRSAVVNGLNWAHENDFIRRVANGRWMINPYYIATGNNLAIRRLERTYDQLRGAER